LLEKLVANIGTLSSIYSKPPEQFCKKIHDRIMERFDTEFVEEEVIEEMDSSGQKKEYVENKDIAGFGNLLDLDEDNTTPTHQPDVHSNASTSGSGIDELLSLGNPIPASKSISDPLAELMGGMS